MIINRKIAILLRRIEYKYSYSLITIIKKKKIHYINRLSAVIQFNKLATTCTPTSNYRFSTISNNIFFLFVINFYSQDLQDQLKHGNMRYELL